MFGPFRFARGEFLRMLVLNIVRKGPVSGMDIIREVEKLTFGFWRPSPGTIYPLLKKLESEGLIKRKDLDRRKVYSLTPRGEAMVREYSFFMPATSPDDVILLMESYINYLEDFKREKGSLPPEVRERLLKISRDLAGLAGGDT